MERIQNKEVLPWEKKVDDVITHIQIEDENIGKAGITQIVRFLTYHHPFSLTFLSLTNTKIGDDDIKVLAPVLPSSLRVLCLSKNNIRVEGANAISLALRSNLSFLRCLDLERQKGRERRYDDGIHDNGTQSLACAFQVHQHLHEFSLCENNVSAEGTRHLSKSLRFNTSIRCLSLAGNLLGNEGINSLLMSLEQNSAICRLLLGNNEFDEESIQSVSQFIVTNTHILDLDLSYNRIRDRGGVLIGEALERNSSLRTLRLCECGIGEEGIERIFAAMQCNTTLLELELEGNVEDVQDKISSLLWENTTLRIVSYNKTKNVRLSRFLRRNSEMWRDRVHFSFVLNRACRVLILGGESEKLPIEILYYLLKFVPLEGTFGKKEERRLMNISIDIATLGIEKEVFLEMVFGRGFTMTEEKNK